MRAGGEPPVAASLGTPKDPYDRPAWHRHEVHRENIWYRRDTGGWLHIPADGMSGDDITRFAAPAAVVANEGES
jgi:hypothetical protein